MPRVKRHQAWEVLFREEVSGVARGWSVREDYGKVRLSVRSPGQTAETVTLPFPWDKAARGDAYTRIRNIYVHWSQGNTLRAAAELAAGHAPSSVLDWPSAALSFQDQKLNHGNHIKESTWNHAYGPVVSMAIELLTGIKPPCNPADLVDSCIRDWAPGSRMRQIRAQSLAQFLNHCVQRENFPDLWLPPSNLKHHIGRPDANKSRAQKGDPFPDDKDIVNLLADLPTDQAGNRWKDALMLLAELGLRPVELLHLQIRTDERSGERIWWCSYQKRSGGGDSSARRVFPIPLEGQDWQLMHRWQAREIELPPLRSGNGAGDSFGTYLNRQQPWLTLRTVMARNNLRLVPYSFRHAYSLRGHKLGIDPGAMAHSMGHSLEVHLRSYPWASASNTAAAFAKATKTR